jgi:hypothetical protein
MSDPAHSIAISVAGEPTLARDTAAGALTARGFKLTWSDPWNGIATKGSRGKQLMLGAFAPYFEVGVSVYSADNATIVQLTRPAASIAGGAAGRVRVKNQFSSLAAELSEVFRSNGVLLAPPAAP